MRRILFSGLICILILTILTAGCGEKGFPLGNQTPKTTATKPTPIPTPAFGDLMVSSNPLGVNVYLEGVYKGTTPLNLSNLRVGKYNVSLQLERFENNNFTVDVKGGQRTTVTKTLADAKPKFEITLTNSSMQRIPPCVFSFIGTVKNTGTDKLHDVIFTIEMKPAKSDYKTVTQSIEMKDLSPGVSKPFGFEVTVLCEGDYKGTLKAEGWDWNNPDITSDDKKISATKTI